jgi:hypothetical protein
MLMVFPLFEGGGCDSSRGICFKLPQLPPFSDQLSSPSQPPSTAQPILDISQTKTPLVPRRLL